MKERAFNAHAHEVRAILDGRKTQTRRVAALPGDDLLAVEYGPPVVVDRSGEQQPGAEVFAAWGEDWHVRSPFGAPGDRLWVRETWGLNDISYGWASTTELNASMTSALTYRADGEWSDQFPESDGEAPIWRPSIHMPRWASRITLEVTGVRVERLNDISEEDAKAEGVERFDTGFRAYDEEQRKRTHEPIGTCYAEARDSFASLWRSINGAKSWASNPWVWVVEFKRVTP